MTESQEGNVTIWVSRNTRERLKNLGRKGESYDDIIGKLIENNAGAL